jgi:hypothetical protein
MDGGEIYETSFLSSSFYRLGGGYPISTFILQFLKIHRCKWIRIVETRKDGSRHLYEAKLEAYLLCKPFKYNYEEQKCLPLKHMKKIG